MRNQCLRCKYKSEIKTGWGNTFYVCGNQCGEEGINKAHPLSPCMEWDCWSDGQNPDCYENDDDIMRGHRCIEYCNWLIFMLNHREGML